MDVIQNDSVYRGGWREHGGENTLLALPLGVTVYIDRVSSVYCVYIRPGHVAASWTTGYLNQNRRVCLSVILI